MTDKYQVERDKAQRPDSLNFGKWTATIFVGHAIAATIIVVLDGFDRALPIRGLLMPYAMLLSCGLVLSPLLYWARVARENPKSFAIRSTIAMFSYMQALMVTLGISAVRLGVLSQRAVLNEYAPVMVPFTMLTFIVFYVVVRQMFKARGRTGTDGSNPEVLREEQDKL